jgi:hypothetical protein
MTEDALVFRGTKYANEDARRNAEREYERVQRLIEDGRAKRAAAFEQRLRERYVAAGGDESEWAAEKAGILKRAREEMTIAGDDAVRTRSASRYAGQ